MKALIVHNSNEVKDCFVGESEEDILKKVKDSEYWEHIVDRIVLSDLEEDEGVYDWQVKKEDDITMWYITQLSPFGDSEDGYTLLEAK